MTSDDGRVGYGEAAPDPEAQLPAPALAEALAAAAPALFRHRDLKELDGGDVRPDQVEPSAASSLACALDTAVCDLLAQHHGVPISRLLNHGAAHEVSVNALVAARDVSRATGEARAARDAGFRCVKLKVGLSDDLAEECARAIAVRRAIGPDVRLRLDANGKWDLPAAARFLRAVSPLDIEYVEQPVPPGDLSLLGRLQGMVDVPLAADEDVTDLDTARRIIATRDASVLVLKPQRLGGIRPCLRVIEEARQAGIRCVVTTNIDAGVGTAACLHLAASLPKGSPACGLATASLLQSDLTPAPIPIVAGVMRVPGGPGLGVRLDPDAIARYTDGWRVVYPTPGSGR
jgi:o-succinylbenzoate synthase